MNVLSLAQSGLPVSRSLQPVATAVAAAGLVRGAGDQFVAAPGPARGGGGAADGAPVRRMAVVADDYPGITKLVASLLERATGIDPGDILQASDEEAAIAVFQDHKDSILIIVSDMQMTYGDGGLRLYRAVRAVSPDMPFVFLSVGMPAGVRGELGRILREDPRALFFGKPFDNRELQAAFASLVGAVTVG